VDNVVVVDVVAVDIAVDIIDDNTIVIEGKMDRILRSLRVVSTNRRRLLTLTATG
jgi:hypothetical protein